MEKTKTSAITELAQKVTEQLTESGKRIAFAESCTGGMLAAAITSVAGSSSVLDMSIVTYANSAKIEYTHVTPDILDKHGAVSAETAEAMASGIRERAFADIGVGVTGIAGPGGGSAEKPVGTVYVAIAGVGFDTEKRLFSLSGDRQSVREQAVKCVLNMLLEIL
jgi:nicotinamide-nucleotide amidase